MFSSGCTQSKNEEEQITSMLNEFYIQYNSVWENASSYTTKEFEEKIFSLQTVYCSEFNHS